MLNDPMAGVDIVKRFREKVTIKGRTILFEAQRVMWPTPRYVYQTTMEVDRRTQSKLSEEEFAVYRASMSAALLTSLPDEEEGNTSGSEG